MVSVLAAGVLAPAAAQAADPLIHASLEDLLGLEATSVAKKRQSVADAAAAVFVITQDDIRRAGARTIPDLLRMVPGVEVGAIDGNSTAVSMRGFNTRFANSVLVLVDGRSLYVSGLSGVLWDQVLEPLDNIERIEVVRGPGATIWGANAVNGIVNIITKTSTQTQGGAVEAWAATDGAGASLRAGGGSAATTYRLSANLRERFSPALLDDGATATVQTRGAQLAGQVDMAPNDDDTISVKASVNLGDFGPRAPTADTGDLTVGHYREGNILGRWSRRLDDSADFTVQAYLDRVSRLESGVEIGETVVDLEANARKAFGRHEIGIGSTYRLTDSRLGSRVTELTFAKGRAVDSVLSGYVQDDYWLVRDRLRLTLGAKLETSSLSGLALEPSARILWRPEENISLWMAWSRAVRTPSLLERYATFSATAATAGQVLTSPYPVKVTATGSSDLESARLTAYEAGARFAVGDRLTFDVAVYHNRYDQLVGFAPESLAVAPGVPVPSLLAQYRIVNNSRASSTGIEVAASAAVTPTLRLDATYAFTDSRFSLDPTLPAPQLPAFLSQLHYAMPLIPQPGLVTTPRSQVGVRARWDVTPRLELDGWLRHVSALPLVSVPAYSALDLRLAWRVSDFVTLAASGQNLLAARRLEFRESLISAAPVLVARSAAVSLRLRY